MATEGPVLATPRGGTGPLGGLIRAGVRAAGERGMLNHPIFDLPDTPSRKARKLMGDLALVRPHLLDRMKKAGGSILVIDGPLWSLPALQEAAKDRPDMQLSIKESAGVLLEMTAYVGTSQGESISTAAHEAGHLYEKFLLRTSAGHRNRWQAIYIRARESGQIRALVSNESTFTTSRGAREWFAEAFALYHANPNTLKQISKESFAYLDEVLAE